MTESQRTDTKKLAQFKAAVDALYGKKITPQVDKVDLPNYFGKIEARINDRKAEREEILKESISKIIDGPVE